MTETSMERALKLVRSRGVTRPRDLTHEGLNPRLLYRLYERGLVRRVARGTYVPEDQESGLTEHHGLAIAAQKVPKGIVCLLSALRFHDLTTQAPFEVWMAIDVKAWRPSVEYPRIRFVNFSGTALHEGVEDHVIEGITVRIYDPAKTIADCFKFRNKIGLDVALDALRDAWRDRRVTMNELTTQAKNCRVLDVMRPYLESLQ